MTGIQSSKEIGFALMQAGLSPFSLDTDMFQIVHMGENYIVLTNPFNNQSGLNRWPEVLPYGNSSVTSNPTIAAIYGDGTYVYSTKCWLFN